MCRNHGRHPARPAGNGHSPIRSFLAPALHSSECPLPPLLYGPGAPGAGWSAAEAVPVSGWQVSAQRHVKHQQPGLRIGHEEGRCGIRDAGM